MTISITPVTCWNSGISMSGVQLTTAVINDNMVDSVTFVYSVLDQYMRALSTGNLIMQSTDYVESNSSRISWILTQLNLTTL